jgi:branched-chain amino acid transport system ATP-binding protein
MRELLRIENLSAGYGEAVVLSNVSLNLAEGQALALLGRNGMGKTTLVNTVVGVTRYFGGTIALDGTDITQLRPAHGAREPDRGGAAGAVDHGKSLRAVSAAYGAARQSR